MSLSLEELLAKEGFKGKQFKTRARASFRSEAVSMPLHPFQVQQKLDSASTGKIKTERTRSDMSHYTSVHDLPTNDRLGGIKQRDSPVREKKFTARLERETRERLGGRGSNNVEGDKRLGVNSSDIIGNEIVEIGVEKSERVKGIYFNQMHSSEGRKGKYSSEIRETKRYEKGIGKDILEDKRYGNGKDTQVDKRYGNGSGKYLLGLAAFNDNYRTSTKQLDASYENSNGSSMSSKHLEENQIQKLENVQQTVSEPALDEVAIQAIISILSGYIKRYLKEEDFRASLHQSCFSSLNYKDLDFESTIISNLEQAIEVIEKVTEGSIGAKDLKKAYSRLSVIASLNSNDLKDGFTSGIPNSKLSACAHIYLSVIYKSQKKDKVSAKHLLQVFCDSPSQARLTLLPELWDDLFSPHLSHLKMWYNQEAESLKDTPTRPRKIKLLNKVYNEILDFGTYQYAVYYKDWLTEGIEPPSLPSIHVPSQSVRGVLKGGSLGHFSEIGSPAGPFSPQPMVCKRLYDAVFPSSGKPGFDELKGNEQVKNLENCMRYSEDSAIKDYQTVTYSTERREHEGHDIPADYTNNTQTAESLLESGSLLTDEDAMKLHGDCILEERGVKVEDQSLTRQTTSGKVHMSVALPYTKENELTLKKLAKSVFEVQQAKGFVDLVDSALISECNASSISDSFTNKVIINPSIEELGGAYEYLDYGLSFTSIPHEFVCPLTGQLFEDPVTLETGQTFERMAVQNWFDQGNRKCPVTGKTLEFLTVPLTNFVLKRVIDKWKSEHCRHLFAFASQISRQSGEHRYKLKNEVAVFILEQLLGSSNKEERITNAKHFLFLGGLQFLLQTFEFGSLEEKTCVAALLSCCIEADTSFRNHVARNIKKCCLLELLHSKQAKSRTNAVLLLVELISLEKTKDVALFLHDMHNEGMVNTMHVLLVHLQSSPPEQTPLVAVLLLYLDLLVEPRTYSIYREEAVDAIVVALDESSTDEKVREKCCRALQILVGHFALSEEALMESWILTHVGYATACEMSSTEGQEDNLPEDKMIPLDTEELATEEWSRNLSISLLGSGKKSFLETISRSLGTGNLKLVEVCLATLVWLTHALASLPQSEFQLSAFSALITRLKKNLENSEQVEHKILASMSLLNFSKIPECRVLLMRIAEEIVVPLQSLTEVSCTAKELYSIISGEGL